MEVSLKPLRDRVIVITGASSGTGLVTARMAAQQGEKVVLAARNEEALRQLTEEIRGKGGQAIDVGADVSVTLVHPGQIDTPYNEHARSYFDRHHRGMFTRRKPSRKRFSLPPSIKNAICSLAFRQSFSPCWQVWLPA